MKFTEAARSLGCEEAKIQAVFEVEAAGRFFEANGEAPQRFEPHKFPERYWPQIGFDPDGAAPWRASLNISVGDRRRMFVAACRIDEEGAHSAASWGAPQIMGFNHEDAGYSSAVALAEGFRRSEEAQIDGFVALVKAWGLDSAIRAGDWLRFARGYNGTGQARTYANRIERAYRRHAGEPSAVVLQAGSSGANVRRLQQAITGAGYPVDVDGRFGPETTSAVRAFQRANGLTVDGIVGA